MAVDENSKHLQPKQREMVSVLVKNPQRRTPAELDSIVPMIMKIQFFKEREMKYESCVHVAETLSYEFQHKDHTVFRQGDEGDKFYIIIDGEVSIKIFNKLFD
jgi:CRP-like cAMP-binding protein